jgi:hypothetical protein
MKIRAAALAIAAVVASSAAYAAPEGKAAPELAPRSVQIKMTPALAKKAVQTALSAFQRSGDFGELGKALGELDQTGKQTTWVDMRGMRKPAKALRHLLFWVGEGHDGAGVKSLAVSRFVGALGRLNVAITSGVQAHIAPAARAASATFAQMNLDSDVAGFRPTDEKAFNSFVARNLAEVRRLLAQKDMTMSEFHDIRKVMRGLYFSVQYSGMGESSELLRKFTSVAARIGSAMGGIHDGQEQQHLKGEIGSLDALRYTMPTQLRGDIEMLIDSLDLGA